MACEEPECRAPVDPRLGEPYVQDHWGQCFQRFVWGRQGGALLAGGGEGVTLAATGQRRSGVVSSASLSCHWAAPAPLKLHG